MNLGLSDRLQAYDRESLRPVRRSEEPTSQAFTAMYTSRRSDRPTVTPDQQLKPSLTLNSLCGTGS
jgi:hypothetical protein